MVEEKVKSFVVGATYVDLLLVYCFINFDSPQMIVQTLARSDFEIGPGVTQFLNRLDQTGLSPQVVGSSRRVGLSVPGALVAMAGDNFQVFEYTDATQATNEVAGLNNNYSSATSTAKRWQNLVHIYQYNNLVIYYLGNDGRIINALSSTASS